MTNLPLKVKDRYDIDPLKEIFYKLKEQNDFYFAKALRNNVTTEFFQFLKRQIDKNENINLNISGRTRSSKSTDAQIIMQWVYTYCNKSGKHKRSYNVAHSMLFTQSEFLNKLNKNEAKFHDMFCIDEKKTHEAIQSGAMYEEAQMRDVDRIAAKFCIHRINIIGSYDDIDNEAFYQLKTYGKNFKNFTNKLIVYTREDNERVPIGYIEIPVSSVFCNDIINRIVTDCIVCPRYSKENKQRFGDIEKKYPLCRHEKAKYERLKDQNIEVVKSGGLEERTKLKVEVSYRFYQDNVFMKLKNKTQKKVYVTDNYHNITNRRFTLQEIDEIVDRVEMIKELEGEIKKPVTLEDFR